MVTRQLINLLLPLHIPKMKNAIISQILSYDGPIAIHNCVVHEESSINISAMIPKHSSVKDLTIMVESIC